MFSEHKIACLKNFKQPKNSKSIPENTDYTRDYSRLFVKKANTAIYISDRSNTTVAELYKLFHRMTVKKPFNYRTGILLCIALLL